MRLGELKRYEKYKDSGVEWIGEVPEGWEKNRLKYLVELNPKKEEARNLPTDTEVTFIPMEKIVRAGVVDCSLTNTIENLINGYSYFKNEDIIIAKVTPCFENGNIAIVQGLQNGIGFGTTELHVLRCGEKSNNRFVYYFLQSNNFKLKAISEMYGVAGLKRIPSEFFLNYELFIPKKNQQRKIANFLDRKTSEIDSLIADKEKLIELLQEQRQAIISEAVTKGLDKNVKMKDSGIEWIGEVPEHWEVSRFRRFCTLQQGLQIAQAERYYEPGEGRYEYITIKSLHSNDEDYIREYIKNPPLRVMCNEEDVLLARTGATGEVITGCNGVFHNNFFKVNYDRKRIIKEYLVIYLKQQSIKSHLQLVAGTTTIPDLNHGDFLDTPFIVPPMEEQKLIIEKVRSELLQVDEAIGIINIQIDRFKEYRQTLISEAVTGKIMV